MLDAGDLLCIFPEGAITRNGEMGEFKGGVMKLLESNPVPVIPLALHNLWGSFFSRADGRAMAKPFRRGLFNRVVLSAGEPVAPAEVTPAELQRRVAGLLASRPDSPQAVRNTFGFALGSSMPIRSYSEITWAPSSNRVAAISRLSSTTIAVVSEP